MYEYQSYSAHYQKKSVDNLRAHQHQPIHFLFNLHERKQYSLFHVF